MKRKTWGWIVYLTSGMSLAMTLGASPTVRVSETEESLELEYQSGDTVIKDTIPLYGVGRARYFSAGVGVEERSADYPPFPLKIIFTASGTAYVTGVRIVVREQSGGEVVSIPTEHVTGPWLFLDLPKGSYQIEATMEGEVVRFTDVKVEPDTQKTLYMRWPSEQRRS